MPEAQGSGLRGAVISRIERFLFLGCYTAARKAALEHLEWSQVDFAIGAIHLRKPGARQTKKKRPTVPMHPRLQAVLERAYAERDPASPYVLDHPGNIRKGFATLVADAGVGDGTPHTLRHTSATHMVRRGVPLAKVAGILGDTIATVERVYAKHVPEALAEAVSVLA